MSTSGHNISMYIIIGRALAVLSHFWIISGPAAGTVGKSVYFPALLGLVNYSNNEALYFCSWAEYRAGSSSPVFHEVIIVTIISRSYTHCIGDTGALYKLSW